MSELKEQLRAELRIKRLAMSNSDVEQMSQQATNYFLNFIDWKKIKSVHLYIPIPSLKEVLTWPILKYIWLNTPQVTTAVSSARKTGKFMAIKVNPATNWRGILPQSRIQMPASYKYDLVVVPTLGFDKRLYRLGWGGGFYDRFLATQPNAEKIGLCFSGFEVSKIPEEQHDIKLNAVITEKGIIGKI